MISISIKPISSIKVLFKSPEIVFLISFFFFSSMMYPLHFKIKILDRIRPVARLLFGPLNNEYTIDKKRDEFIKVVNYCKEIKAPQITSDVHIKNKWSQWKQDLSKKVERKSKTGAPRGEDFNEAELTINAIIKENPCLQKNEVYASTLLI